MQCLESNTITTGGDWKNNMIFLNMNSEILIKYNLNIGKL